MLKMKRYSPQGLNVVCPVGSPCEVRQVELDLIPSLIQPHRHCADEWLYSRGGLVVRGSEPSSNVFVIEDLHFKGEVFF